MEDVIGPLLLFGIAVAVTVFVGWIVLALVARVLSIVVVYWAAAFLLGGVAGLVAGVVLPLRVLVGKGGAPLWQITPADLVAGKVVGDRPAGPNREYGWDSAWPNYMPYQARQDAKSVGLEVRRHLAVCWAWVTSKAPKGSAATGTGAKKVASGVGHVLPKIPWYALTFPGFVGYLLGAWASALAWYVVMGALGLALTVVQQATLVVYRLVDIVDRRSRRASLKCPYCYGESRLPGFRCSGPGCTVVHWTALPGPLGLFTRRCSCGQSLPNTVRGAAKHLVPVCPYCQRDLVGGSGARQTVQIAVIGSIGAGKSRLLDSLAVEMSQLLPAVGGTFTPLDDRARAFLDQAKERLGRKTQTPKTQHGQPVGLPFAIQHGRSAVEVQVMDVAGEAFANWDETAKLRYLDTAGGIVLVLDPLALPGVNDAFRRSSYSGQVALASGDQEEAYAAAVDRMKAESVPVGRRGLAVVLAKGDILTGLPVARALDGADGAAVRQWLVDQGMDLMVRRFEKDFREVRYFLVDSMNRRDVLDHLNPWWTLEWLLKESRTPLRLAEAVAPPPAPAPEPEPANA